jgi:hypothetical protein
VKLYEGRNIVEVSGGAFKEYHVINAKGITVNVTTAPDGKLKISFGGIKTPLEKIAGIYNPGFPDTCYVKYGSVRSSGVQYTLNEDNAITVSVPASGKVELTGGVINCDHLGDPLGSHRTRVSDPQDHIYRNLDAVNIPGTYSVLPDIILTGQTPTDGGGDPGGDNDSGGSGTAGGTGGGCDAGAAGILAIFAAAAIARNNR